MPERMIGVGRFLALAESEQQQSAVSRVDQRMAALGKHRRAAGKNRGHKFGRGDGQVAGYRRENRSPGFSLHALPSGTSDPPVIHAQDARATIIFLYGTQR